MPATVDLDAEPMKNKLSRPWAAKNFNSDPTMVRFEGLYVPEK